MNRRLAVLVLLVVLVSAAFLSAQTQKQPFGVTERVDVNLRTILAIVTDSKGTLIGRPLSPADIEVLEDGVAARVVAVEPVGGTTGNSRPATPGATTPADAPPPAAAARPKRIFYLDSSLLQRGSAKRVLDGISANLRAVLAGGDLEIVLADPSPTTLLQATADEERARQTLKSFSADKFGNDHLQQIRIAFLQDESLGIGKTGQVSERARSAQARFAIQEEIQVIRGSLQRLGGWAAARVTREPAVLFLVIDGFDSDVSEFYRNANKVEVEAGKLHQEFGYVIQKSVGDLAVLLASQNLQTIPIGVGGANVTFSTDAATIGHRPFNDVGNQIRGTSPLLFVRPLEPLREIAQTTGGEVLTRADRLGDVLDRLSRAVTITYRMERPADGRSHRLEVRSRREGVALRAARTVVAGTPEMASNARAAEVLQGSGSVGSLPIEATVRFLEVKRDKRYEGNLHVVADLAGLLDTLEKFGPGRIRVTVAFENSKGAPSVQHEEMDLVRSGSGAGWTYDAVLQWSPEMPRVAVMIEELKTGARGSVNVALPGPDRPSSPAASRAATAVPVPAGAAELPVTIELLPGESQVDAKGRETTSASVHITLEAESVLPAIATAGKWQLRVTVEAEAPNVRFVVAKSDLLVPFDIATDHWDFYVPVKVPGNVRRLFVTLNEPSTGSHAAAVLDVIKR